MLTCFYTVAAVNWFEDVFYQFAEVNPGDRVPRLIQAFAIMGK
jgi:hypothetical protein